MKIKSRHTMLLLLLVAVFLMPGLLALYCYQHPTWLTQKTINKGQFIESEVRVHALSKPIDVQAPMGAAKSKWHLLLWSPSACQDDCINLLEKLSRVRLALGRHFYEVDEVLLSGETMAEGLWKQSMNTGPLQGVGVLQLQHTDVRNLSALSSASRIFIANPQGYLVLSYAVTAELDDVYRDLHQLLTTTSFKSN